MDEVPYLMGNDDAFEGTLQRSWDRFLERKPVLLILIGSDLSMMEALNSYERPFHQRRREMVVGPLNPAEIGSMLDLAPAATLDAALLTGGLPLIRSDWHTGADVQQFLSAALANPVSALIVSAERSLAAEFPESAQARLVLRAIGSGERTFGNIAQAAGGDALARMLPDENLPAAPVIGGYWTRTNDIEIDIVGADRRPVAES